MQRKRKRRFGVNAINAIISQTDDGVDAETSLSLSLSAFLSLFSSPPLHFFLALTLGLYILSLKMRVSSKELFSTLKMPFLFWMEKALFSHYWFPGAGE